jgi:hypothetical protein
MKHTTFGTWYSWASYKICSEKWQLLCEHHSRDTSCILEHSFVSFFFEINAYWLSRYVNNISLSFMSLPVHQQKQHEKQRDVNKNQHWKLILYALFWVIPRRLNFYMPTFRNTLSVPSSQADSYDGWLGLKMLAYLYGKRFGTKIARAYWHRLFSSQTISCINTPTFSNPVILHSYPPIKMEQTECSETSAYKNSEAWELSRRKRTTFRIRRKFEI